MKITTEIREHLARRYDCDRNTDIETDGEHINIYRQGAENAGIYAGTITDAQRELDDAGWIIEAPDDNNRTEWFPPAGS